MTSEGLRIWIDYRGIGRRSEVWVEFGMIQILEVGLGRALGIGWVAFGTAMG